MTIDRVTIQNEDGDKMALCYKCHTRMSKEKLKFHKDGCVPDHTKGHDHFIGCRSRYKPKEAII